MEINQLTKFGVVVTHQHDNGNIDIKTWYVVDGSKDLRSTHLFEQDAKRMLKRFNEIDIDGITEGETYSITEGGYTIISQHAYDSIVKHLKKRFPEERQSSGGSPFKNGFPQEILR